MRSYYISQADLELWESNYRLFQPPEMLGLSVCATMPTLPVAHFNSLMQSSILLSENTIVRMAPMADQMRAVEHIYLLSTLRLIIVGT